MLDASLSCCDEQTDSTLVRTCAKPETQNERTAELNLLLQCMARASLLHRRPADLNAMLIHAEETHT